MVVTRNPRCSDSEFVLRRGSPPLRQATRKASGRASVRAGRLRRGCGSPNTAGRAQGARCGRFGCSGRRDTGREPLHARSRPVPNTEAFPSRKAGPGTGAARSAATRGCCGRRAEQQSNAARREGRSGAWRRRRHDAAQTERRLGAYWPGDAVGASACIRAASR